jgi:hypothetical protein
MYTQVLRITEFSCAAAVHKERTATTATGVWGLNLTGREVYDNKEAKTPTTLVRYDLIDAFFSSSSVFLCSTTSRSSRFDFDSSPSSNERRSVVLWCLICCKRALWDTPKKILCTRALLEQQKQQYHEQQRRCTHIMSNVGDYPTQRFLAKIISVQGEHALFQTTNYMVSVCLILKRNWSTEMSLGPSSLDPKHKGLKNLLQLEIRSNWGLLPLGRILLPKQQMPEMGLLFLSPKGMARE